MCAPALPPFDDEDGAPPLVDNPSSDDDEDGPPPLEVNPPSDDDDGPPPLVDGNDAPSDHVCACGCGRGLVHHNEILRLLPRFTPWSVPFPDDYYPPIVDEDGAPLNGDRH
jgi:hypothetical protein